MITSLFPEMSGHAVTLKSLSSQTAIGELAVKQPSSSSAYVFDTGFNVWGRMAADSTGALYLIGPLGSYTSFVKVRPDIIYGVSKEWSIEGQSTTFGRVTVDASDYVYVTRTDGTLQKYNSSGELLWTIECPEAEKGLHEISIGANGNVFAIGNSSTLSEYDTDGNVVNSLTHTITNVLYFYVNESKNVFIATTTAIMRLDEQLNTVWTKTATLGSDYRHSVCIDKTGDIFYCDNTYMRVTRLSPDGEVVWTSESLYSTYSEIQLLLDNAGGIYIYNSYSGNWVIYKLDAETGKLLYSKDFPDYYGPSLIDPLGNIITWEDGFYMMAKYYGTVYWNDDTGITHEKYILHEIERGDDYVILQSDEEV